MRDVRAGIVAAIKNIAAKFQTGILSKDFSFERHQLQPADGHKVVIIVDGSIAAIPVKDAGVIRQQIFLVRPKIGERFPPELNADLPLGRDRAGGQTALDREQGCVRRNLF